MSAPIPFHVPHVVGSEHERVADAIASGFGARGKYSRLASSLVAEAVGTERVLLTHSCTGALELMALALGAGPGSDVVMPSYTFSSTASAFARTGASVRFADIDPDTLCLDPVSVRAEMTDSTLAVVTVGYAGMLGEIDELKQICEDAGVALLEDAAQSIGVSSPSGRAGAIGSMGAISFHSTKNVHCDFGGALIVRSDELDLERIEHIWERGTNRSQVLKGVVDKYTWVELGSSFQLGEMPAAFLSAQLEDRHRVSCLRSEIFDVYSTEFPAIEATGAVRLIRPPSDLEWNHHAAVAVFESESAADIVRLALRDCAISAYIGYVPLHSSPMGRTLGGETPGLPQTESVAARILRLPIHTAMSPEDAQRIVRVLAHSLERQSK